MPIFCFIFSVLCLRNHSLKPVCWHTLSETEPLKPSSVLSLTRTCITKSERNHLVAKRRKTTKVLGRERAKERARSTATHRSKANLQLTDNILLDATGQTAEAWQFKLCRHHAEIDSGSSGRGKISRSRAFWQGPPFDFRIWRLQSELHPIFGRRECDQLQWLCDLHLSRN